MRILAVIVVAIVNLLMHQCGKTLLGIDMWMMIPVVFLINLGLFYILDFENGRCD